MGRKTLLSVTRRGNYQECLDQLAKTLAKAIDDCTSKRDLASLSKRYLDVIERREATSDSSEDQIAQWIAEGAARVARLSTGRVETSYSVNRADLIVGDLPGESEGTPVEAIVEAEAPRAEAEVTPVEDEAPRIETSEALRKMGMAWE